MNQPNSWSAVIYLFLKLLFCILLVGGITFLSYKFNSPALMWWYLLPVFAYLSV